MMGQAGVKPSSGFSNKWRDGTWAPSTQMTEESDGFLIPVEPEETEEPKKKTKDSEKTSETDKRSSAEEDK